MGKEEMKSICKIDGWNYVVFWRINHTMLTMEEVYCEEESVVDTMLLQVHTLGQGIIGGAAVDGEHRWMCGEDISRLDLTHFSSGIKTIAVLPLKLHGVIQLGSINEISETRERLDRIANLLQQIIAVLPAESASSSFISEPAVQHHLFASFTPSQDPFSTSCTNTLHNAATSSLFDFLDLPFEPVNDHADTELPIHPDFGSLVQNTQHLVDHQLAATDFPPSLFGDIQMDDLTQWLADSSELFATSLDAMPSIETRHTFGVDVVSSSLTANEGNALHSYGEVEIFSVDANNDSLLQKFGTQNVAGAMGHTPIGAAPWKGLFSELGLDHLLRDEKGATSNCSSISCVDDQWSPSKKRRVEDTNNGHLLGANAQIRDFGALKDWMPKSEPGLLVQETYAMDAKSCISTVNLQSRKSDEPAKPAKKRAKPGESKKPRPKDRQQIAERINELRDLIPNGAKLSIDALLGRTIKHMDYLQNLTKHADQIKQVHEPKLIGQSKGLVQKSSSRNATWAFEVGGSTALCPIIVEDLGHPCQMLIEMLCEEREYFLEMADIVRGYGLTILKGVMEERNSRIWAQFTVEAKKPVERVSVFMSLMQIFQGTSTGEVGTAIEPQKVINSVSPLWGNYQQHVVPISI